MENLLKNLEEKSLKNINNNNNKNSSINNKNILIKILLNNNYNRDLIPIKSTVEYYKLINNKNLNEINFNKKIISFKNSLDTLISNFNNLNKINNDQLLKDYKLIKNLNNYKLINKK